MYEHVLSEACSVLVILLAMAFTGTQSQPSPYENHYDLQYQVPQEFLLDSPLRQGGVANVMVSTLKTSNLCQHDDATYCYTEESEGRYPPQYLYKDHDWARFVLDIDDMKDDREVFVLVPLDYRAPRNVKHIKMKSGARAPRVIIKEPKGQELGRFQINVDLQFHVPFNLDLEAWHCDFWLLACWSSHWERHCPGFTFADGVIRVTSEVHVHRRESGTLAFTPHTNLEWLSSGFEPMDGPRITGCSDYSAFFGIIHEDINARISETIGAAAMDSILDISKDLQEMVQVAQDKPITVMKGINMTYAFWWVSFKEGLNPPTGRILSYASVSFIATNMHGEIQAFPSKGGHNHKRLPEFWNRTQSTGAGDQLVLLGGGRASESFFTSYFEALQFAGYLEFNYTVNSRDAELFTAIDISKPLVAIDRGGEGAELVAQDMYMGTSCVDYYQKERSGQPRQVDNLIFCEFNDVRQRLNLQAFISSDHNELGIKMNLTNMTLGNVNIKTLGSNVFFGTRNQLKNFAQEAYRKHALTKINAELHANPFVLCGETSPCRLVPFVPNPSLRTVGTSGNIMGYIEISWQCSCRGSYGYEECQNFKCPEVITDGAPLETPLGSQEFAYLVEGDGKRRLRTSTFESFSTKRESAHESIHQNDDLGYAIARFSSDSECSFAVAGSSFVFASVGQGRNQTKRCSSITDRLTCCQFEEEIQESPLVPPTCIPAKAGLTFSTGSVCEDQQFVNHACVNGSSSADCAAAWQCDQRGLGCSKPAPGDEIIFGDYYRLERMIDDPDRYVLHTHCDKHCVINSCQQSSGRFRRRECFLSQTKSGPMHLMLNHQSRKFGSEGSYIDNCIGGVRAYNDKDVVLIRYPALRQPSYALHLPPGECVACALLDEQPDLWCVADFAADPYKLTVRLFCKTCFSLNHTDSCYVSNDALPIGLQGKIDSDFGLIMYYATTAGTQPSLRSCPPWPTHNWPSHRVAFLPVVIAVISILGTLLVLLAAYLKRKRLWQLTSSSFFCRLPRVSLERGARNLVAVRLKNTIMTSAALHAICGIVWYVANPQVSVLENMESAFGLSSLKNSTFDDEAAQAIVQGSRTCGLIVFLAGSVVLLLLSMSLCPIRVTGTQGEDCWAPMKQPPRNWYPKLLLETTSTISFLAFSFWRADFSEAYEHQASNSNELDIMVMAQGYAGSTMSMIFSTQLLLSWVGPFMLVEHIIGPSMLCTWAYWACIGSSISSADGCRNALLAAIHSRPFVLIHIILHSTIETVLGIVFYRSGYANAWILVVILGCIGLNILFFLFISRRRLISPQASQIGSVFCFPMWNLSIAFAVVQAISAGVLACMACAITWTICFFSVTLLLVTMYMASASVHGLMSILQEDLVQPVAAQPVQRRQAASFFLCWDWIWEITEAADSDTYGSRIKWRRLCLVIGATCMMIGACQTVNHMLTKTSWDDLNLTLKDMLGEGICFNGNQTSVLAPLVDAYGKARKASAMVYISGASIIVLAIIPECLRKRSISSLQACRIMVALGCALILACVVIEAWPDYVGLLDFESKLHCCGPRWAQAVSDSMRAMLGAGAVAKAWKTFLPPMVCLPWTLGRITFFLAEDDKAPEAVDALFWSTVSGMLRLSILVATACYIIIPRSDIVVNYALFLGMPTLVIFLAVNLKAQCKWSTHLLVYLFWGWVAFLVPLIKMLATVRGDTFLGTISSVSQELFSKDHWALTIAEFALSDVLISDLIFMSMRMGSQAEHDVPLTAMLDVRTPQLMRLPRFETCDPQPLHGANLGIAGCTVYDSTIALPTSQHIPISTELGNLARLHSDGALTDAEFHTAKTLVLGC